jgi:hypothetical protein
VVAIMRTCISPDMRYCDGTRYDDHEYARVLLGFTGLLYSENPVLHAQLVAYLNDNKHSEASNNRG